MKSDGALVAALKVDQLGGVGGDENVAGIWALGVFGTGDVGHGGEGDRVPVLENVGWEQFHAALFPGVVAVAFGQI